MNPEERVQVEQGDITHQRVDAIVNAANSALLGGGGVDGAIHRAAGPGLLEECRRLQGCPVGKARITAGHDLPARWVIHTVGPVWHDGGRGEQALLAACYRNSLALAQRHGAKSVAFPAIGTGAYRFPLGLATRIAITETLGFLRQHPAIEKVVFVCFGEQAYETYRTALEELSP